MSLGRVKPEMLKMTKHPIHSRHLSWRATFGRSADEVNMLKDIEPKHLYDALVTASSGPIKPITVTSGGHGIKDGFLPDDGSRRQQREELNELNLIWLDEMCCGKAQLREKMAFFWHGHFACRNRDPRPHEKLLHVIRTNAMENCGIVFTDAARLYRTTKDPLLN